MDLTGFIPAKQKADLPACWRWKLPDAVFFDRLRRKLTAESPRYAAKLDEQDWRWQLMAAWQRDRCAICGRRRELIRDHDHETGLIRGFLCRQCNTQEGAGHHPEYGAIHPALICGVREMYTSSWASAVIVRTPSPQFLSEIAPLIGDDPSDAQILACAALCDSPPADLREYARGRTDLLAMATGMMLGGSAGWGDLEQKVKAARLLVEAGADEFVIDGWTTLAAAEAAA
jgi:ribosomal protein S14